MNAIKLNAGELPANVKDHLGGATFLGSTGFAQLWTKMKGRDVYWVIEQDGNILAVLTGVEFGKGSTKRLQSMPDSCYAFLILLNEELDRRTAASTLLKAIRSHGYMRWYVTDYYEQFQSDESCETTLQKANLVNLTGADWLPPDKKLQSEIRKAEREGVQIHSFSVERHFDQFMTLMQNTEQRHGRKPKYSSGFFRALAELASHDLRVQWLVVEHESGLAASHIYFVEQKMLLNWQVYFDKSFSFLKPNQCMMYHAATTLARHGVTQLNLGATPPGAEELSDYKRKWGGSDYEYKLLSGKSWLGKLL